MKSLNIIIYTLMLTLIAAVSTVRAQQQKPPTTVTLNNKATGEKIGTITFNGNRSYLRDKDGALIKTIVRNEDGSMTTYDPDGKIIANPTAPEK